MSTTERTGPGWAWARSFAHGSVVAGVVGALVLASTPVHASPFAVPTEVARVAAMATGPAEAAGDIDGAIEAGDLQTAQSLATDARKADPSAANWLREAQVYEQSAQYQSAARAYQETIAAASDDEAVKAVAAEGLARVRAASRGTVADEPESTHRSELDKRWMPPAPEPEPAPVEPTPPPADTGERIVTKWYFWVTVGAIAASAAAVTAIAIRAARDDQPDALDSLAPRPPGRFGRGLGFRF